MDTLCLQLSCSFCLLSHSWCCCPSRRTFVSDLSPAHAAASLFAATGTVCAGPAVTFRKTAESEALRHDRLDVQSLLDWAADSAKVDCSSLAADSSLAVRGMVASQDIKRNAIILDIPRNLTMAVMAGQKSPMPDLVPEKTWSSYDE